MTMSGPSVASPLCRRGRLETLEQGRGVNAQDRLARGGGRLRASQRGKAARLQRGGDGAQPLRLVGPPGADLMGEAGGMGDEQCRRLGARVAATNSGESASPAASASACRRVKSG